MGVQPQFEGDLAHLELRRLVVPIALVKGENGVLGTGIALGKK